MTILHNKPALGMGVYTPPDISVILRIPQRRIRRYIDEVWDNRFGKRLFNERYSWNLRHQLAVNFLVLIEFKVVFTLRQLGVPTRRIFKARNAIAEETKLPYPFATSNLLADSKRIWYRFEDTVVNADGTRQLNFQEFVERYCKSIDFGLNQLAQRFWPDGRDSSIIVDPHHQFGQPVIEGTNITAETIYAMYAAGESVKTLTELYEISEKNVSDAVSFYKRAA